MSKSGYYKKQVKRQPYSNAFVFGQLKVTKALLMFCRDHNRESGEYASAVFEALTYNWSRLMVLSVEK